MHLQGTNTHQQHHRQIDDHIGHRVHQGGNPSGGELPLGQLLGLALESSDFRVLHTEGPQHPNTSQVLPGGGGDAVQGGLYPLIHGHGNQHNAEYNHTQHRDDPQKHQSGLEINGKGHHHGAKHHKR